MKQVITILIIILNFQITFGQDKPEKAFKKVVNNGYTTAPYFVVLTVKNLNTGQIKEILTNANSLQDAFKKELDLADYGKVREFLTENSKTRFFEMKNEEALEILRFEKYKLKSEKKIENIIHKENLIDSLCKIQLQRKLISVEIHKYYAQRRELINEIKDSISLHRQLTKEEETILNNLMDLSYDYHYNSEYAKISNQGRELMKIWNFKVNPFKKEYTIYEDELERLETKFFRDYQLKYGMNFCHVVFKYGAIFYRNCINGMLEFGQVVD